MSRFILLISLLSAQIVNAQDIRVLNGKWSFTGLRTTVFKVENEKLYVGMLEYADTTNFNRFVSGLPVDSSVFKEAAVSGKTDSLVVHVRFPSIDHDLKLVYLSNSPNYILFTGDVFFDSTKVIVANNNCNVAKPGCINRLYGTADLKSILELKNQESFTRDDAFEFLLRLNQKLKSRCNKCYAGFTDAYMNEVLIEMGFNPIVKRTAARSVWYNTSGFTFYIKTKFSSDERIVKLADYIFDWYLK